MFTYFLTGEDSTHRLERLTLSQSTPSNPADAVANSERTDPLPDELAIASISQKRTFP